MNNFQSIINIIENISLIIKGGGGASFKVNFKKSVHGIVFRITTNIKEKFFFKRGVGGGVKRRGCLAYALNGSTLKIVVAMK